MDDKQIRSALTIGCRVRYADGKVRTITERHGVHSRADSFDTVVFDDGHRTILQALVDDVREGRAGILIGTP